MKKILTIVLCVALVAVLAACGPAPTASPSGSPSPTTSPVPSSAGGQKVIGYYKDAADDYYKAGFEVFKALAEQKGWKVIDVVGGGTAPEQVTAIENFITQKVDAIVCVQNSPNTTSECLKKANDAKIPYFALTHNPPNEPGLAGFSGFDWVTDGKLAGDSAVKHNVKKAIIIEGKLGQGTAGGQTNGFLTAYKDAGKDIGNLLSSVGTVGGGKDLQVVYWGSGGWFADPAYKEMQNAIAKLGKDGWDGAYVENDEMMTGAVNAIKDAGLNPGDYWLGASNGKEKSWDWVANGTTTMDVNQCPTLEADVCFQQISAYFDGKTFPKAIFVAMYPFEKSNINKDTMIPWVLENYMSKRAAGAFKYDMNDPSMRVNPDYK